MWRVPKMMPKAAMPRATYNALSRSSGVLTSEARATGPLAEMTSKLTATAFNWSAM